MSFSLRRLLIGDPLRTSEAGHQKLSKIIALPVFASDALSSVAFATEEIMAALLVAGATTFGMTPLLSLGIVALLVIVTVSYQQTIAAYPGGGGSYTVAGDNLGPLAGCSAGAALLVDYLLNAAVCASAGAAAVASLLGNYGVDAGPYAVPIALGFLAFITVVNLRGTKESGALFAVPVYGFVLIMLLLIGCGIGKLLLGSGLTPSHPLATLSAARVAGEGHTSTGTGLAALEPLGIFLLLRAFASGCTALTGVEAISNGVQAFRDPAPRNARITMVWMASLLGILFLGVSYLATHAGVLPPNAQGHEETVLSQVGRSVFGTGPLYLILQFATCGILILSANTSFADFPRLCSLMARDNLLPHQLANVGDKLVFDRGIWALFAISALLVVGFKGSVHALIPLFAIGAFGSFTLSQAGMVKHWFKLRERGWQPKALLNGIGATTTLLVTLVFAVVKFTGGAWVVMVLLPALIVLFSGIRRHYQSVAAQLRLEQYRPRQAMRHHVFVLVPEMHQGVLAALVYARTISPDARALHIVIDPERGQRLRQVWELYSRGVPLVMVDSPYRALLTPLLDYIKTVQSRDPHCLITIVVPEAISPSWWTYFLHGQSALALLWRLRFQRGVIATHVPYHLSTVMQGEAPS